MQGMDRVAHNLVLAIGLSCAAIWLMLRLDKLARGGMSCAVAPSREYSTIQLATPKRYRGIEPLASVWKTEVLPLYEYRGGFINEFYAGGNLLSSACAKQAHH